MESINPPLESVRERRTKSWKREHEETCTRRYQGQRVGVFMTRQSSETSKASNSPTALSETDINSPKGSVAEEKNIEASDVYPEEYLPSSFESIDIGGQVSLTSSVKVIKLGGDRDILMADKSLGKEDNTSCKISKVNISGSIQDLYVDCKNEKDHDFWEGERDVSEFEEKFQNISGLSDDIEIIDAVNPDDGIKVSNPVCKRDRTRVLDTQNVLETTLPEYYFSRRVTSVNSERNIKSVMSEGDLSCSTKPDAMHQHVLSSGNGSVMNDENMTMETNKPSVDIRNINCFQNGKLGLMTKENIGSDTCMHNSSELKYDTASYLSNKRVEVSSISEDYLSAGGKRKLESSSSVSYYDNELDIKAEESSNKVTLVNVDIRPSVMGGEVSESENLKKEIQLHPSLVEANNMWMGVGCPSDDIGGICSSRKESNSDNILGSLSSCLIAGGYINNGYIPSSSVSTDITGYTVTPDGMIQVITVPPNRRLKLEDKMPLDLPELDQQDRLYILAYVCEASQRIAIKDELRAINHNVSGRRPDDRYFTKLDSSLKKNTAFVRKLKTFTGNQLESLVKDLASLNLTKYVSEVAAALVEAKLKMIDVWPAVQLCNILHQTYSEFSTYLLDNWHKVLTIKKDEKIANQAKLRVDLRFYAELISVGIFTHKEGLPLLGNVLTMLTHSDKEDHHNINIILSFCRHCGDDYAGLIPRKLRELSEKFNIPIPRYKLLPKEKQRNVKALLKDYFNSLCRHLRKEHLELQTFIRQNRKILQTKGELSSERKERLENLQASFDRIVNGAQQFAEALDEDVPQLPEDESLKNDTLILNGSSESEEGTSSGMLWEDEETRRFYECFPDMKEFMPSLQVRIADPEPQISEETLDAEFEGELVGDPLPDDDLAPPELEEVDEPEPLGNASNKILLEAFLTALPNCINREMIDSAAVDFVMTLNTKHNRRKLVKTLFGVPRIRLDLLPFYARLVATLHPVMPDIATDLAQMLKQDFKYHVRKKDQMNIESKIKIVRFIGELVKFRMYSKIEGLYCLKVLVQDFTHHHIEMCCNLLESCGRFFFRHPDCYQRMRVYLDQMMRKKAVMALDSRYVTMIENAYYYVNPPESTQCVVKERPEEHQFIRKILYQHLMKSNTDKVLRLMRKLDWSNSETNAYAVKCLTYAFKVKYFNIRCMASLLAGLATQQDFVGTQVVDGVLEDIRLGMEINLPKYNQRRVAMIKYLGELYNYRMVESSNVFQVLYSLITFAITWDHGIPSPLDPPDNLFRIRLVCVLLETCGQYFISGVSKKKLDTYLVYFQHYFWFKLSDPYWTSESPFPVGMNYMFKDTVTSLRPSIHLFESFEEATDAVRKLRTEESVSVVMVSPSESPAVSSSAEGSLGDDSYTDGGDTDQSEVDDSIVISSQISSSELDDIKENIGDEDAEEEDEEDEDEDERITQDEKDDEDEEDFSETPSEIDETDTEWASNSDVASHVSEGDSQNDDVMLLGEKMGFLHGPTLVECPEDDEFLSAFDRMVSDNIQDRMKETVKPQQVDISVPLHIKGSAKKTYDQLQEEDSTKSIVNFVLMLRKGHKQQYKNLAVPINSEMALNLKNREEAERAEKERVKRLTLDINERLEEEDYQEMLAQAQRPVVMNLNRERRHKYQHPKGAPDADLIFGPKKVR